MMKFITLVFSLLCTITTISQKIENVIIITTDGLRWQEVFNGMDTAIANNRNYNQDDSAYIFEKYWSPTPEERRKKLMPFFWSFISSKGQIYGNRLYDNKIEVANPYRISYPGYSELFTGFVDTTINSNNLGPNPNRNLLEHLNSLPAYKNRVVAFTAWEPFNNILNEKRSGFPVIAAFDNTGGKTPNAREKLINEMLAQSYRPWLDAECLDIFTHQAAFEWLKARKPRVLYIGYGETDEWAHSGMYRSYLDATRQVDTWLKAIWNFIQSDPQYRNKTALIFTTDHGRGDLDKKKWTGHYRDIEGSEQTWLAVVAPGISPLGEVKTSMQLYQKQVAATIARLLGIQFKASHPVALPIEQIFNPSK